MSETDRIERVAVLRAPRARVWKALSDAKEFGAWFGVAFEGPFAAGQNATGTITDPPGMSHLRFEIAIERVEAERLLSFRWHPYAIDPAVDYSGEPMTLVELRLEDADEGGTRLTVVESGFDAIPAARRAQALRANRGGWDEQLRRVERHVTR